MEVTIINIGNSKGIRLSKTILERYGIKETILLTLESDHLVLKAKPEPRKHWEKAFRGFDSQPRFRKIID